MFDLPIHSTESALGERGLRMVQDAVEGQLKWIFRTKRKADVGVDGEIEVVHADRRATGILISAQIKCGRSYFGEPTDRGFIFRGDLSHFRYWIDHSLPVILVLCDPESEICYWSQITSSAVTLLEGSWKIEVLRENQINAKNDWKLAALARSADIEEGIGLAIYQWLQEKYFGRIEIATLFELPRDYHWYAYLAEIDDDLVMIHYIYDRYGRFDPNDVQETLRHREGNAKVCGARKLIVCLVSQSPSAFRYSEQVQQLMDAAASSTTFVRFLNSGGLSVHEVDDQDDIIDAYSRGRPLKFGQKLFDNNGESLPST